MSDCLYSILLSFFSAFFFVLFRFQDPRHDLFFFLLSFGQQIKRKWKQEKWNTMKSEQRRKNERNEFLFYERLIMIKILIYFLKCEFEQNNDDDYYLNEFFFSLFSALMINITLNSWKLKKNFLLKIQIHEIYSWFGTICCLDHECFVFKKFESEEKFQIDLFLFWSLVFFRLFKSQKNKHKKNRLMLTRCNAMNEWCSRFCSQISSLKKTKKKHFISESLQKKKNHHHIHYWCDFFFVENIDDVFFRERKNRWQLKFNSLFMCVCVGGWMDEFFHFFFLFNNKTHTHTFNKLFNNYYQITSEKKIRKTLMMMMMICKIEKNSMILSDLKTKKIFIFIIQKTQFAHLCTTHTHTQTFV